MGPLLAGLGGAALSALPSIITSGFNLYESGKNRRFQERMSSTAHQREVYDLQKAGLNPILSSKLGGSSTPGGSQATLQTPDLVNSAISMASASAQIKDLNSAAALKDAQTLDVVKSLDPKIALLKEDRAYRAGQGMANQPYIDAAAAITQRLKNETLTSAYQLSGQKVDSDFYKGVGQFAPYLKALKEMAGIIPKGPATIINKTFQGRR